MSSGQQEFKTNKELLEDYEKDYLQRLENEEKPSTDLQNTIYQMGQQNKELERKDYIGFCVFCTMGVTREEMTYKNNLLFHPNCFEQQGSNFPVANQQVLTENSNAKVELILLKNLKARYEDTANPTRKSRLRHKKKAKRSSKKRKPKRRTAKKKRTSHKRRKAKKRTARRRPSKKRRSATKRGKPRRRTSRKTKRRSTRRRPSRRRSKRSSSKRRTRRR